MHRQNPVVLAIAMLVLVNALWGMSFPIMKALSEIIEQHFQISQKDMPLALLVASSSGMIAVRFTIAFGLLTLFLPRLVKNATRGEWLAGAAIGVFFSLGLILQVAGLATIPASRSGFLTSLTAVYTPLMAAALTRKPPSLQICIGIALALVGVLVLSDVFPIYLSNTPIVVESSVPLNWGDLWTTLGALFFSVQVLLIDRLAIKHRSPSFTPGMFASAVLVTSIFFLTFQSILKSNSALNVNASVWIELVLHPVFLSLVAFLALFCSLLSFLGMNTFQPYISASQASVIYSTEPVFASLWAMVLPGCIAAFLPMAYGNERVTWQLVVGGVLILFANVIALWPTRRKKDPTKKEMSEG